ncbi:MAG: hypothetical protein RL722_1396 [Pseudomonadota bacterium]
MSTLSFRPPPASAAHRLLAALPAWPVWPAWPALLVLIASLAAGLLWPASARADQEDPPARVGRIARIDGRVSLEAREGGEVVEQPRNWPLTSGDMLQTGRDARVEIRIGASLLRVGESARLRVVRLDDQHLELHLQRGSLALQLPDTRSAMETVVSSPEGRFLPQGAGFYRVDAGGGEPGATAWQSPLRVEQSDGSVFQLAPGQAAQLYAGGGWRPVQPESDEFARWSMQPEPRPAFVDREAPALPADMTGAEDLAWYGDWQVSEDWGPIWWPRDVSPGWAPYREGRWAWVAPWGWTWVDDAPWGFAPFHYGRWVFWSGRWGWVPGEARWRAVYAPALVGWLDQPAGVGRQMVWFPLGPREVYLPGYRCSPRHRELLNQPYLRQPVPRGEWSRWEAHERRGWLNPPAQFRYQGDWARAALPRQQFEQGRRPVETPWRRDEWRRGDRQDFRDAHDWRERREREHRRDDRRDDRREDRRDGNAIESIRLNPALQGPATQQPAQPNVPTTGVPPRRDGGREGGREGGRDGGNGRDDDRAGAPDRRGEPRQDGRQEGRPDGRHEDRTPGGRDEPRRNSPPGGPAFQLNPALQGQGATPPGTPPATRTPNAPTQPSAPRAPVVMPPATPAPEGQPAAGRGERGGRSDGRFQGRGGDSRGGESRGGERQGERAPAPRNPVQAPSPVQAPTPAGAAPSPAPAARPAAPNNGDAAAQKNQQAVSQEQRRRRGDELR